MVSVQVSGSASDGGMPLLRMKWRGVGVMGSSSRCGGVSALSGRSFSSVNPSFPTSTASSANAAGMRPAGMLRWNGIAAPTIAAMAASPAPRRKPRRSGVRFASEEGVVRGNRVGGEEPVEVRGFRKRRFVHWHDASPPAENSSCHQTTHLLCMWPVQVANRLPPGTAALQSRGPRNEISRKHRSLGVLMQSTAIIPNVVSSS